MNEFDLRVPADRWVELFGRTKVARGLRRFASASGTARPVITGVCVQPKEDGGVVFIATDTYILGFGDSSGTLSLGGTFEAAGEVVLMPELLNQVCACKALKGSNLIPDGLEVEIRTSENGVEWRVGLDFGGLSTIEAVCESSYPKWRNIIPADPHPVDSEFGLGEPAGRVLTTEFGGGSYWKMLGADDGSPMKVQRWEHSNAQVTALVMPVKVV